MATLHVFSGDATHEDSLDGLNTILVISEDISPEMKAEAMEDHDDETEFQIMSRAEMDSLAKSIEQKWDTHGANDGFILDLTEPYILGWGN